MVALGVFPLQFHDGTLASREPAYRPVIELQERNPSPAIDEVEPSFSWLRWLRPTDLDGQTDGPGAVPGIGSSGLPGGLTVLLPGAIFLPSLEPSLMALLLLPIRVLTVSGPTPLLPLNPVGMGRLLDRLLVDQLGLEQLLPQTLHPSMIGAGAERGNRSDR